MAVDVLPNPTANNTSGEPSTTALVTGIVKDAQELLTQQLTLLKVEAQAELRLTAQAAVSLGIGLAMGIVAGVLLALGLVHLLEHFAPGYAWFWYLIVGAGVAVVAGIFVMGAIKSLSAMSPPLPESQEAIKETLEWQTTPR